MAWYNELSILARISLVSIWSYLIVLGIHQDYTTIKTTNRKSAKIRSYLILAFVFISLALLTLYVIVW